MSGNSGTLSWCTLGQCYFMPNILVASQHYKNGNLTSFQFLTRLICAFATVNIKCQIVGAFTHVHVRRIGFHVELYYYAFVPLGWYYIPHER